MQSPPERVHGKTGLSNLRVIARLFDELIRVPGTNVRFGLDAVLGLLPGGGDLLGGAVSAYAIMVAARLGAPASVIARMLINIAIDTVVGAIPLLGDLFDVAWKANRKNIELLEQYERAPERVKRSSVVVVIVAILFIALLFVGVGLLSIWIIRQIIGLFS